MAIVTHFDKEYSCTTAIKGGDYVHLLNENGKMIVAFDGVTDFSSFSISEGTWKTPTPEHECCLAVVKDDGMMGKGGHKCSDVRTGTVAVANGGTGAVDVVNAANNLGVQSLGYGINIPANADLNNYTTVGNYRCSSSSTGATVKNTPVSGAFTLVVRAGTGTETSAPTTGGWKYFIQEYYGLECYHYRRKISYSNATTPTFGDWIKIYDSNNKPTASEIGALPSSGGTLTGTLTLGSDTEPHMVLGNNEILAKTEFSSMGTLYIQGMSLTDGGVVAHGSWKGSAIGVEYGGTGAADAATARKNLGIMDIRYSATEPTTNLMTGQIWLKPV